MLGLKVKTHRNSCPRRCSLPVGVGLYGGVGVQQLRLKPCSQRRTKLNYTELTCIELTQLHDALLVTRVSVTKLIGCRDSSSRTAANQLRGASRNWVNAMQVSSVPFGSTPWTRLKWARSTSPGDFYDVVKRCRTCADGSSVYEISIAFHTSEWASGTEIYWTSLAIHSRSFRRRTIYCTANDKLVWQTRTSGRSNSGDRSHHRVVMYRGTSSRVYREAEYK